MKKKLLSFSFFVCLFFFKSYSIIMASEEPPYKIIYENDTYEIRYYSDRLVVQAVGGLGDNSFRKLFNYISGSNNTAEKIEMTVPVTQSIKENKLFMQFYVPSKFNKETVPLPTNPDLEISIIDAGYFAVVQFSGRSSDKNFIKHTKILEQKLLEDKISINGSAIKATYNSPFTLPPFRRNEAMFRIEWKN